MNYERHFTPLSDFSQKFDLKTIDSFACSKSWHSGGSVKILLVTLVYNSEDVKSTLGTNNYSCPLIHTALSKDCFTSFSWILVYYFFSFTLSDTSQKFELTVSNLTNMRQECEALREELRVLSEKLLKQHDAALDSQVWSLWSRNMKRRECSLSGYTDKRRKRVSLSQYWSHMNFLSYFKNWKPRYRRQ